MTDTPRHPVQLNRACIDGGCLWRRGSVVGYWNGERIELEPGVPAEAFATWSAAGCCDCECPDCDPATCDCCEHERTGRQPPPIRRTEPADPPPAAEQGDQEPGPATGGTPLPPPGA